MCLKMFHHPFIKRRKWLQFMADKDDEPSPADQTLTINSEEQPNKSTTKEELQSGRRRRIQLEIELEHSITEIQLLKD